MKASNWLVPALSFVCNQGPFSSFPSCIPKDKHAGLTGFFWLPVRLYGIATFHFEEGGIFNRVLLPLTPTRQVCEAACVSHHDELLSAGNECDRRSPKTATQKKEEKKILHFRRWVTRDCTIIHNTQHTTHNRSVTIYKRRKEILKEKKIYD